MQIIHIHIVQAIGFTIQFGQQNGFLKYMDSCCVFNVMEYNYVIYNWEE